MGKKGSDGKEYYPNDHTSPNWIAILDEVHSVDDVADNVEDKKPKIW